MTPKEKAKELIEKYYQLGESIEWTTDNEIKEKAEKFNDELGADVLTYWNKLAKESALIAVNEIINCDSFFKTLEDTKEFTKYWYEVQQEINKL